MNIILCVEGVRQGAWRTLLRFFFITLGSENSWITREVLENTGIRNYSKRSDVCSLWEFGGERNGSQVLKC